MSAALKLLVLITCLPSPCFGALVSLDWQERGDGLVTLDTATDLQWLDFSVMLDHSYDEAEAMILGDPRFIGFSHASTARVIELFTHAGIVEIPSFKGSLANVAGGALLSSLMGSTLSDAPGRSDGANAFVAEVLATGNHEVWQFSGTGGVAGMPGLARPIQSSFTVFAQTADDQSHPWYSHYLVRPIPEPSPVSWVPIAAAIALCYRNRRCRPA
ncbi:MAG: hypothetical protein NTW21_38850 [Verrucomicrobia bacterium]|nr:hypothetical protein [Verrucomicrobiota bacterium]